MENENSPCYLPAMEFLIQDKSDDKSQKGGKPNYGENPPECIDKHSFESRKVHRIGVVFKAGKSSNIYFLN